MRKSASASETVEVPRAVLEGLLGKVESLEGRLRSSEKEVPSASP